MAIACTVVTPASDVALSMAFMTQNVYAENIQTTFPDGWNKDDKDDKKTIKIIQAQEIQIQTKTLVIQAIQVLNQPNIGAVESPTPTPTAKEKKAMESIMLDYQNLIFRLINGRGQSVLAHWRILWLKVFTRCVTVKQKTIIME